MLAEAERLKAKDTISSYRDTFAIAGSDIDKAHSFKI